jgi:hypothetical protein
MCLIALTLLQEALLGDGWDRHFFALKLLAQKRGLDLELFKDHVCRLKTSE